MAVRVRAGLCVAVTLLVGSAAVPARAAAPAATRPAAVTRPADTPPGPTWTAARLQAGMRVVRPAAAPFSTDFGGRVAETGGVVVGVDQLNGSVLTAVDAATGGTRWTRQVNFPQIWGATGGRVYVSTFAVPGETGPDQVLALDATTGATVWSYSLPDQQAASRYDDVRLVDGHVLVSRQDPNELQAFDPATGALRWTAAGVGGYEQTDGTGGRIYAGSNDTDLVSLDPATGAVRWRRAVPGGLADGSLVLALSSGRVVVATGNVYQPDGTGREQAFDGATGAPVWSSYLVGQSLGERFGGWASAGGTLYVTTYVPPSGTEIPPGPGHLWAVDEATGQATWVTGTDDAPSGDPYVGTDYVLTGCTQSTDNAFPGQNYTVAEACAFRRSNGQPMSTVFLGTDGVGGPPTVAGDDAFAYNRDGLVTLAPAPLLPVPGRIEAEATDAPVLTTTADDTGGGLLVGYFPAGGTVMDYPVDVARAGAYTATFRVASDAANLTPPISPRLELQLVGTGSLASVAVPETGGWQSWQSVAATVTLPAGPQRLRIYVPAGEHAFNINWFDLEPATAAAARTARALPRTTAAARRTACLAGLRPSATFDAVRIAAACATA